MTVDLFSVVNPVIAFLLGFGGGWYVRGRGIFGVKVDVANAEKTVTDVVNQIKAP